MRFAKGEIAIHVGNGDFTPNTEVEIVAVGPFKARQTETPDGWLNRDCCDYVIKDLSDGGYSFTIEQNLRKRPDDQPFTTWFREHIITDPMAVPNLETTMLNVAKNLRGFVNER